MSVKQCSVFPLEYFVGVERTKLNCVGLVRPETLVLLESLFERLSDRLYLHVRFQLFVQLANLLFQLLQIVGLVQEV